LALFKKCMGILEMAGSSSSSRPPTNKPRGVCRYYKIPGGCFAGESCKFLHGEDSATLSPFDASKTCRYYQAGYCKRGASCWFKHVDANGAGSSSQPGSSSKVVDEAEQACSICFETPTTFGLLEGCGHVFCHSCIRNWRDPHGKSLDILISGVSKTCPFCRARSRFVTPSSKFVHNDDPKKAEIIERYKASMAKIPCKYFQKSTPEKRFCPYGKDCFYEHKDEDGNPYEFTEGVDTLMEKYKHRLHGRRFFRENPEVHNTLMLTMRSLADSLLRADSLLEASHTLFEESQEILGMSEDEARNLTDLLQDRAVLERLRNYATPPDLRRRTLAALSAEGARNASNYFYGLGSSSSSQSLAGFNLDEMEDDGEGDDEDMDLDEQLEGVMDYFQLLSAASEH